MIYLIFKLIHIFSVLIYAGFLFTDNLILMRMQKVLSKDKYDEVRGYFKAFTKVLVPKALVFAVISGIYLLYINFGVIEDSGLSNFQILLLIKSILGLWLGLRGILQVFFGIQPFVFKGHTLPFVLVITIVLLSQIMWYV
ncbi:hypothetical protein [Arcobacter sp. F2176]|uniref:hypothetical protein n=1 Tax=Arcobacter sp. F2176 TaxID=2044511 RepID=UPI00100C10BF|nr:hypothetical protein [Arcobacter sp. F2176]RXJ80185.1 hypothetical protein CRU95_11940 [Arcobacter sp. F2176]